jgi:hypothetical protein
MDSYHIGGKRKDRLRGSQRRRRRPLPFLRLSNQRPLIPRFKSRPLAPYPCIHVHRIS